jgi:fumarylacetoacetase
VTIPEALHEPNDPTLTSWVPVRRDTDFVVQNLPFGVIRPRKGGEPRVAIAIGDHALDLAIAHELGLLDGIADLPRGVFAQRSLNAFLALGRDVWTATRRRLSLVLSTPDRAPTVTPALRPLNSVESLLPIDVGDFVDFYSSLHHATNLGRILRPNADPLFPNWRQLPVGYHGRGGTVVVSGSSIVRPHGLVAGPEGKARLAASRELDFELEVGFVVGYGNERASAIPVDDADRHVFGVVLLNDWSARDIQGFEYQPLGPFLGKSFATTISPWVVTLDALRPYLVPAPLQEPSPEEYLQAKGDWALDLDLEVDLNAVAVTRTNFRHQYWTFAQQLAHLTINGATTRPGDLFGSGAVSGPAVGERGSMIELTWRGRDPLALPDGSTRCFLEDGDTVTLRAHAGPTGRHGVRVGFGSATGTIVRAMEA